MHVYISSFAQFNESADFKSTPKDTTKESIRIQASRNIKIGSGLLDYLSEIIHTQGTAEPVKLHYAKIKVTRDEKKITGIIDISDKAMEGVKRIPEKSAATLTFEINRDFYPNIHVLVTGKFPNNAYQNFRLKIDHDKLDNGQLRNTTIEGTLDDLKFSVGSKIENTDAKKSVDLSVGLNEDPVRTLTIVYENTDKVNKSRMHGRIYF